MTIHKIKVCGDIFGVPVGTIADSKPIHGEKYKPDECVDKEKAAQGVVGAAVGTGAVAALTGGGGKGAAQSAATVAVVSLAVTGAVAGVSALYKAVTHQRVTYVTIRNSSLREYSYHDGYTKSGHISAPEDIPARSIVRLAFHNEGSFSGAVSFVSDFDYLYIGASNPMIGKNKLRVECTETKYDLYKYWDDMDVWKTKYECGRNVFLKDCVYDNPSQCTIEIYDDDFSKGTVKGGSKGTAGSKGTFTVEKIQGRKLINIRKSPHGL